MATKTLYRRHYIGILPSLLMILLYYCSTLSDASDQIDAYASTVASRLSQSLIDRTKKITNYHKIQEDLETLNSRTTKNQLNGRQVILDFKQNIEGIFSEKTVALKNIKKKAMEAKSAHVEVDYEAWPELGKEFFKYPNIHENVVTDPEYNSSMKVHHPFSPDMRVSTEKSFVQIPTNIYSNSTGVLNTVNWTRALDETFKENYFNQSKEKLLFQYYGDQSGLMRLYPGATFGVEEGKVDLFDCRRRVWYIQASASPKDIVIIIDVSGSMTGSNIGIARIAANSFIDTLSENDYFNVITVNDTVEYIKPCAKYLIQATKANKEEMKRKLGDKLQNSKPTANANDKEAIRHAFDILGTSANHTTASCNQAILFISDGIEGENVAEEVFKERNPNRTVRAFALFVGRTHVNVGKKALLRMACDNRGYFYPLESVGNIWDTVLGYLKVMSRPLFATKETDTVSYTPLYLDSGGMGMIMTISMSVFDNREFIGVTGTDITLESLLEKIPVSRFGPYSYIFMINNNGFLVMHPKLKSQTDYLVAPRNVFLEDLVRGMSVNKSRELKKNMVDQKRSGEMKFPMFWLYDNNKKCTHAKARVFYEPIDGTEFSGGVVIADDEMTYRLYTDDAANDWLKDGIDALGKPASRGNHDIKIATWEYCNKPYDRKTSKNLKTYYTAAELNSHFTVPKMTTISDLPSNCDPGLVKQLLVTAGVVNKRVDQSWNAKLLNNSLYRKVFVTTNGGYARHYAVNNTVDTAKFMKPPYFEMAASVADATVNVMVPYGPNGGSEYITVSAGIKVGPEKILTAVSGMEIGSKFFEEIFKDAANDGKAYCYSNDSKVHICAIIDHNAYIVSSNQGDRGSRYTGRWIGEISKVLIDKLAERGIFQKVILEDTQEECPEEIPEKSFSNTLITPFKFLYQVIQGSVLALQTMSWIAVQYATFLLTPGVSGEAKEREKPIPVNVSCTKSLPFYVFNAQKHLAADKHSSLKCSESCNIVYYLKQIPDTNLLFLYAAVLPQCRFDCMKPAKLIPANSLKEEKICNAEKRYRRQPTGCFNREPMGNNQTYKCGRAGLVQPSVVLVVSLLAGLYYMFC